MKLIAFLRYFYTGFIVLYLILAAEIPALAQQSTQQNQRATDERVANEFYRNRDWEQAKTLYLNLYNTYKGRHHYNYYFNCLIQLNQLDEAEKAARKMQRQQKDIQSDIDLGYVLQLKGNSKKAADIFDQVIRQLPADRNIISLTANTFRSRNLDDYALLTYEKGSKMPAINYGFHLEKANLYQMSGNTEATMDEYLLHIAQHPEHIDLIKSRIQNMLLLDIDNKISETVRTKLLEKAQKQIDNFVYNELLVWYSLQEKDFELAMIQVKALDRRWGDREPQILELASISFSNAQYEVAEDGYAYVLNKGRTNPFYTDALIGALKSGYYKAEEQYESNIKVYQKLNTDIISAFQSIGFNRETYELGIIQARILTFNLNQHEEARTILEKAIMLPLRRDEQANLKMHMADILLFQGDVWEATLLYSQIDKSLKNEPVAHEARYRNARLRYFIGEFGWALTQLDVLKAATSKLISNDAQTLALLIRDNLMEDTTGQSLRAFAKAELLSYQHKTDEALHILDSLLQYDRSITLRPHLLMTKAALLYKRQEYDMAETLYQQLFQQFPDSYLADKALFQSGLIYENQFHDPENARLRYERIFNSYPSSMYAVQARQKYRHLRGDKL
ncbi:MAG: tetratricopeptide repeat protein [Bacteroidales bacterium]|nr:tetratricopeptide repeat protein [Bacteroidales bacterium]